MNNKKSLVLLAEDEENLREIYSRALEEKDFEVLQAENGKKALKLLDKYAGKINLLVLDIVMPQLDGFDTLKKIRKDERHKDMKIVVSTSLSQPNDREAALELGATEYLVKTERDPWDFAEHMREIVSNK